MGEDALRKTGIEAIGDVPWGMHFCQFYKTKQDLIELLVPYFKAGLAQNEFCMWITSEPLTEAEARSALRKAVPDVDRCLAQGQLEILPYTDYHRGGVFESDRVLKGWVDKLDQARAKGFEGLRLTGNTFWLESKEWHAFTDYDQKVNRVIGQFHMLALCTYSLDKCGASEVIDVVSNHQFALIKREGRWARIQNSGQKRVETALRESEERFRATFEHAAVGIAHVAPSGRWLRVNRTLCEIVGYGSDELLAKTFQDITHPDDLQSDLDHVRRMLAGEIATYAMEKRYVRKDGALVWINLTVALIRDPEGHPDYFISVVEDISARKRVEEELRRLTAELEQRVAERTAQLQTTNRKLETEIAALIGLTKHAATQHDDLMASLRRITETSARTLGVARASIWRFDQARSVLRCVDLYELDANRHSSGQELRASDYPGYFLALSGADVIDANDAQADPRTREFSTGYLTPLGIRSMMNATIRLGGAPEGVVRHEHVGPERQWTQDERAFAVAIASQAALILEEWERKRLEGKHGQLAAILAATSDFVATADPDGRVLYMNQAGRNLIGFGAEEDLTGLRIADKDQPLWPADALQQGLSTAEREGRWSGETELPTRDGRKIPMSQVILAHKDAAGAVAFFSTIARDITERKQAEETLRQAEQKLREILEHSTNVFYAHTPDHVLTYLSPQASALLACAPVMAQTKWTEFLTDNPVNQQGFELTQRAIDTGQVQPAYEMELKAMDGRVIWVEVHEAPVVCDGKTMAIVGSLTDITDRKRAEQEVRLAKERFQSLVETIGDWIWEIDRNERYTYVSPRIRDLLGYEPADVIGKTPFELMPPDEAARMAATFETFRSVRAPFTGLENTNLHKDGRRIVLETSGRPVFDVNGEFLGYRGTDRDITERKQSEEEQRRLQCFLDSIIEHLPDMVFVKDARDLRFVLFNKAGEALIGRSQEELIGKRDHDFFPKEQADFFAAKDREVLAGGRLLDIPEELIQTRNKGQRILHTKKIPILDEQGLPRYLLGLSRDITERKQAEEHIRLVTSALEAAANGVVITDAEGTIQWVNPAFTALTGYRAEDVIGRNPRLLKSGQHDKPFYEQLWNTIKTKGMEWRGEVANKRKDGSLYTEEMTITPVRNDQGVISHFIAIKQNVSLRKQMEAQAVRLERLAAIGQLLGGLAHELRNPLFILTGHLHLFREKLLQQEYATLPADLEKIESAAGRMSRITERFLALARPAQPRLEFCAVPTVLTQTLEFLGNELMKNQIRVDAAIAPDLPLVLADPKQLQEVFLNLMMNAMQAMAKAHGKGTLTVSAALAASPRLPVSASADTGHGDGVTRRQGEEGNWIEVRIQDDGPGIPPEHRARLFEPFFSTKSSSEGTGLGLWTIRTTIIGLKGHVTYETEVGRGTTFIVRLPVSEELPIQRH